MSERGKPMQHKTDAVHASAKLVESLTENQELTGKEKQAADNRAIRRFRDNLGLIKSSNNYGKLKPRTILRYIRDARKLIHESDLCAVDCEKVINQAIKKYPEFANRLAAIANAKDIKQAWRDELATSPKPELYKDILGSLKLDYHTYYKLMSDNVVTVKTAKTEKKKEDGKHVIKKNKGDEKAKGVAIISAELITSAVADGLEPEQEHLTKIILALALCTGRRPVEILKVGTFEKIDDNHLMFSGQAKQKHKQTAKPYAIPVLYSDADTILETMRVMRDLPRVRAFKDVEPEDVSRQIGSTLSDATRATLKHDNVSLYTCRAIYADVAYRQYLAEHDGESVPMTKSAYIARILGHLGNDIKTAQSYEGVSIDHELSPVRADELYRIQLAEKKSELLARRSAPPADKAQAKAAKTGAQELIEKLKELRKTLPDNMTHKKSIESRDNLIVFLIDTLKQTPSFIVSRSTVRRLRGGKMKPIDDLLNELGIEKG